MTVTDLSQKRIFVVLGMARTGTSAISRALKVFGVNLGEALTEGNAEWNPTGFWEDKEIVYGVNGKIFSCLDFAPYGMMSIPEADLARQHIPDLHASAAAILQDRLRHADYFGFKDPSTIKVLPFWREVFHALHVQDYYLIALRNPLASARSYQKLTGCELELGLLLWCSHLLQAVDGTRDTRRIIVSYDLLMQDPHHQLKRIQSVLHAGEIDEQEAEFYARKFLDKKLNRFQSSEEEFSLHDAVRAAALTKDIYDCLMKIAKDEWTFDCPEFIARWQEIHAAYDKLQPMYSYLDRLLKKRGILTRKLHDTRKSVLWKVVSPLMFIESRLHKSRRVDDSFAVTNDELLIESQDANAEMYPLYQYANAVLKQNLQLLREIHAIKNSLSWKLFYPLWQIDDYLRVRRRNARMYKRLVKAYG